MHISEGKDILVKRSNAFHDRYFKAYGQLMLRISDEAYLMSRENLMLQEIREADIEHYDINTGDIGNIFKKRKDINAMVFACTEPAVAYSQLGDEMKPALDDLAQIVGESVRISPTNSVKDVLLALSGRLGCFIKGVGIFAVGRTVEEAIAAARIIEKSAEAEVFGTKLGGLSYLPEEEAASLKSFYNEQYSQTNSEPHVEVLSYDEREFELRSKIIDIGKKMAWDDLVQGTWGNISVKLNDEEMLVTPSAMDYFSIRPEDIVKIKISTLEYDRLQRVPTSESKIHAAVYMNHPEANAVIHTHSNGCSVFAAAHAGFRIDAPELKDIIGNVNITDYAPTGTIELAERVLEKLVDSHACIIANHGALFYGNDLDLVLAIANAVETRACNLLGYGNIIIGIDSEDSSEE